MELRRVFSAVPCGQVSSQSVSAHQQQGAPLPLLSQGLQLARKGELGSCSACHMLVNSSGGLLHF